MFRIFKKNRNKSASTGTQLGDVQIRPVEKAGIDPLERRLEKTRNSLGDSLKSLFSANPGLNEDLLEELETTLLVADLGVKATLEIIDSLRSGINSGLITHPSELLPAVQAELYELIEPREQFLQIDSSKKPFVILVVGVNGAGKTTTIGKLAQRYKEEGLKVMLAAGDTFRAAAVEQLQSWGQRNQIPVIAQATGADSASVIYDALESARARGMDVLIADTAGRLQTQSNLMEELSKIHRVLGKLDKQAPHEVMLVLDAGTGQNAISQAKLFNQTVKISGITLSKLDGTAKGGVLFGLATEIDSPIRYIGVGESAVDLRPFDAGTFINAILPIPEDYSSAPGSD